jgi:SPP1 family predicted phage head-tail adaptor
MSMSSPMQSGKMRRPLAIQRRASGDDGYGNRTDTWTTVVQTWGQVQVRPQNALIAAIAGQLMAQSQYTVTLRFPPSVVISPGMRVLDGTRILTIHQVTDIDERHRTLQLFCQELPAT